MMSTLSSVRLRSILILLLAAFWAGPLLAQEAPPQEVSPQERSPQGVLPEELGADPPDFDTFEAQLREAPRDLLLASEYRQEIIAAGEYRRAVKLFEELAAEHPDDATIHLSLGYALVDKIPAEGSITQVLLANEALSSFTRSLELSETWLGLYTRGHSYVFWPAIFGRTKLGIEDLERAIEIAEALPTNPLHSRAWVALGDAYWRLDDVDQAREIWAQGQTRYPDQPAFDARLSRLGSELNQYLENYFDPLNRVDTDLTPLWPGDRSATPGEVADQRSVEAEHGESQMAAGEPEE